MNRQGEAEWLAGALEFWYRARDVLEEIRAEKQAEGQVSLQDRIAMASVRETIDGFIERYHRKLRDLARRGGHGRRVDQQALGAHGVRSHECAVGAEGPAS